MLNLNKIERPYLIGEIGINHNGDIQIAKKLIDAVFACDWDCAKFQKRNPDIWGSLFDSLRDNSAVQRVFRSGFSFLVELDTKIFQLDIQKDIKIIISIIKDKNSS